MFSTISKIVTHRITLLQQILNLAAQHLGNGTQVVILGIVDIALALLKELNGSD